VVHLVDPVEIHLEQAKPAPHRQVSRWARSPKATRAA
jgi:hypothetical protein